MSPLGEPHRKNSGLPKLLIKTLLIGVGRKRVLGDVKTVWVGGSNSQSWSFVACYQSIKYISNVDKDNIFDGKKYFLYKLRNFYDNWKDNKNE